MCEPTTIMMGIAVAGSLMSAAGQAQQGAAAQSSANFNAQVAQNNAIIARQQAGTARDIGKVEAAQVGLKARQLAGLQRASLAGNGVLVGSGSAADIVGDTTLQSRVDTQTIRENAARKTMGFLQQGSNFDAQSGLLIATGSNAASAANMQATGTLLSGAGTVAGKWQDYKVATT